MSTSAPAYPDAPVAPAPAAPSQDATDLRAAGRNAASSYGFRALRALSILLLTPYLFRGLGVAGFGTWSVVFTLATIYSLVEIGFSTGVTKLVAELHAGGRRRELADTVAAGVAMMAVLGLLAAALSGALALLAPTFAAPADETAFALGMLVLGGSMIVRFPCVAYGATLLGRQRYDLFNLGETVTVLLFAAGAVVAVEAGGGVFGLSIAYAASLVAGGVVFALLLRRVDPELPLRPRLPGRAVRRRVAGLGSLTLLVDSMDFVAQRMDTVVIAAVRGASAAAPYGAALRLISGVQGLILPVMNLLLPMVSDLQARGARAEVARRFVLATRFALQLTLPLAAGLSLFAQDIARAWLGPETPGNTAAIIGVLLAVQVAILPAVPAGKVLIALGRMRAVSALAIVEGVSNLALSIWLVSRHGAIGAAIGTLVTSALVVPLRVPLAARATGAGVARTLREGILPAVVATAPGAALMVVAYLGLPAGAGRAAAGLAAGLGACAAVAILLIGHRRVMELVERRRV